MGKLAAAFLLTTALTLHACAVTASEGMLASITAPKALDKEFLRRQCEMEDAAACYLTKGEIPPLPRLPIAQGVAPADRAVFVVQLGPLAKVRYYLRQKEDQSIRPLPIAKVHNREHSSFRLERIEATKLEADKTYELLLADLTGHLIDARAFTPLRDGAEAFRFAFVSGADSAAPAPEEAGIWKSLVDRKPRLLFGLGNMVATTGQAPLDPAALWDRYADTRNALSLFRSAELIPIAATWNEQDYGTPGGKHDDRTNPHTDEARDIQEAFFPAMGDIGSVSEGPGLAKSISLAGQTWILLDDRSFREGDATPPACRDSPAPSCPAREASQTGTIANFGRVQESWALEIIENAKGPVWLLSANPWFGAAYPTTSFEGSQPAAFANFRAQLENSMKKAAAREGRFPLFLGSANPFFTEARMVKPFLKSNYAATEFSVGPIHPRQASLSLPASLKAPVKNRALAGRYFFFTSWPNGAGLKLSAEAVEPENRAAFELKYDAPAAYPSAKTKKRAAKKQR
ncbi:MAG: hypothetical protein EOP11_11700 [Proteobacteria bacterium]|nr:MAG: hypothetical protein EOP11_11700 [Pseudomonadota bacterium]